MLVVHERFTSHHAMYRCYAPAIKALAPRFELLAMSDDENMDEVSRRLFERSITIEPKKTPLSDIVKLIQEQAPDIVYYPSLGMSHWTTILSTLRLAPMQFITLGHPATSKSNAIDYVYTSDMKGDLSSVFSERVLVGPKRAMFEAPPMLPTAPCDAVDSQATLKIAINSKVMKISHRLLEICARLERNSNRPLEFVLFPGERFHYFDGLVPNLKSQLSTIKIMRYVGYEDFITELRTCHLALAAFPFGNTNSTVDTCLLGIPTVAHFGPESPAQSDKLVMETVGLPDWLACDSDEKYYNAALRLIQDDELRNQLRDQLLNTDIKKLVFETPSAEIDVFPDMIMWAYENHLALQKSATRVYHYENLPNL